MSTTEQTVSRIKISRLLCRFWDPKRSKKDPKRSKERFRY